MYGRANRGTFRRTYRCHSALELRSMTDARAEEVELGGKIILPPSALEELAGLQITYPMLFQLENRDSGRTTHCGVLEFVADEGHVYLPTWMMRNLAIQSGQLLQIQSATCPVASFSKFQPQSVKFLDITNPKAVLENTLRRFACLTEGDMISIQYNNEAYELLVMEVKPGNAVSIIETDMSVDFAPAVGYVEPEPIHRPKNPVINGPKIGGEASAAAFKKKIPVDHFAGEGVRVDSKAHSTRQIEKADTRASEHAAILGSHTDAGVVLDRNKGGRGRLFFARSQSDADDAKGDESPKSVGTGARLDGRTATVASDSGWWTGVKKDDARAQDTKPQQTRAAAGRGVGANGSASGGSKAKPAASSGSVWDSVGKGNSLK